MQFKSFESTSQQKKSAPEPINAYELSYIIILCKCSSWSWWCLFHSFYSSRRVVVFPVSVCVCVINVSNFTLLLFSLSLSLLDYPRYLKKQTKKISKRTTNKRTNWSSIFNFKGRNNTYIQRRLLNYLIQPKRSFSFIIDTLLLLLFLLPPPT